MQGKRMADILDQVPALQGFDPLAENAASTGDERLFEEATKRIVQNILKSYTGYFDIFSELIQNSLDAIDAAKKAGSDITGKLWIIIDIPSAVVTVTDNGVGMGERELRYCFRPSVSFKSRRESRGHKGVGATFLGYGFNNIQIHTRKEHAELSVQLSNGRSWADDYSGTISRLDSK
jgi:signal transduction histidine kinase